MRAAAAALAAAGLLLAAAVPDARGQTGGQTARPPVAPVGPMGERAIQPVPVDPGTLVEDVIDPAGPVGTVGAPLPEPPGGQVLASATLYGHEGDRIGTVAFSEEGDGVLIQIRGEGLPPGAYGAAMHEQARCDWPGFETAGPVMAPFGTEPPAGLLPDVEVGPDGVLAADILAHRLTLEEGPASLLGPFRSALILTAAPAASGDGGGGIGPRAAEDMVRVACAPIVPNTQQD
jgi:Cu-Zn family superoxide dismutase